MLSTIYVVSFIVSLVLAAFGVLPGWGVIWFFYWVFMVYQVGSYVLIPFGDFLYDLRSSKDTAGFHYHGILKFRYSDKFHGKIIEDPAVKEARDREAEQRRYEAEQRQRWEERQKARQAQNAGPFPKDPWWSKSFTEDDLQRLQKLRTRLTVKGLSRFPFYAYRGSGPYLPDAVPSAGLFRFPIKGNVDGDYRVYLFLTEKAAVQFGRLYEGHQRRNEDVSFTGTGWELPSAGPGYVSAVLFRTFELNGISIDCL